MWARLNEVLNRADRPVADWAATPSLVYVGSQSVKLTLAPRIFERLGTDGGKYINGSKRQTVTDVEGRIFACYVHAANGYDSMAVLQACCRSGPARVSAWSRYPPTTATKAALPPTYRPPGLHHELASWPPTARGFVPVVKRWVVERTYV